MGIKNVQNLPFSLFSFFAGLKSGVLHQYDAEALMPRACSRVTMLSSSLGVAF